MSCLGMTCGHIILGTYTFLKTLGYGVEIVNWIPILSFSLVIFAGSSGILTVPFTLLAEIMPPKIKSTTVSFCIATNWICAFLMVKVGWILLCYENWHQVEMGLTQSTQWCLTRFIYILIFFTVPSHSDCSPSTSWLHFHICNFFCYWCHICGRVHPRDKRQKFGNDISRNGRKNTKLT